jgi:DNA-binding NarL/FixJ family response regulator
VRSVNVPSDAVVDAVLSDRELAVARLVVEGMTNRAIAEELHLSTSTVQAHVASAMRKLQASSRTQLAVSVLRRGIVPLHPPAAL